MKLSARNMLKGKVVEVESGAVNCVVKVDIGAGQIVSSMITLAQRWRSAQARTLPRRERAAVEQRARTGGSGSVLRSRVCFLPAGDPAPTVPGRGRSLACVLLSYLWSLGDPFSSPLRTGSARSA